jgi:hypothetical protein
LPTQQRPQEFGSGLGISPRPIETGVDGDELPFGLVLARPAEIVEAGFLGLVVQRSGCMPASILPSCSSV